MGPQVFGRFRWEIKQRSFQMGAANCSSTTKDLGEPFLTIRSWTFFRKNSPREHSRAKLVLIGATATGIGDLRATPFGGTNFPGVEIHANVIDNILNERFLKRGSTQALTDALLIVAFGIPLGIWMALVSPRWMWFGIALLGPLVVVNYAAFLHG